MDLFIASAYAADPAIASPQGQSFVSLIMLAGMFAIFYFFIIRPQQKRQKEHRKLIDELKKGDEVVISGGLLGRLNKVEENFVSLEIANNVEVKVQKQSVISTLPKGTIKAI